MNKSLDKTILILNLIALGVITLFLWYRLFLPTAYVLGSIFLGLLLAVSLTANRSKSYLKFLQIFTIFFFILNVFYIGTNYKILPFGDSYVDYGVTRIFDQNAKVSVIKFPQSSGLLDRMSLTSGWPLIQSLTIVFSQVTGIPLFQASFILPLVMSSLSFVFVYVILKKIQNALNLTDTGILFGLLVFMSWPNLIFWSLQFGHMSTGLMFFTILIYLVLRYQSETPSSQNTVLLILFSVSLILTHHLSSFIMVTYLILMAFIITIGHYSRRISGLFSRSLNSMWFLAITVLALLILWWDSYATVIWPVFDGFLKAFIQVLYYHAQNPLINVASYPSSLTPLWATTLNYLRIILILGLAVLGFLAILKRKAHMRYASQISFLSSTGLVLGILWILAFQSGAFEWTRIITYALPLLCIYATFFVDHYVKKLKKSSIIISFFTILLVVSSFTGLWGVNFAPLDLYNPAVNSASVGEHNVDFAPVGLFLNKHVTFDNIGNISSDDPLLLLAIIPTGDYEKITALSPSDFNPTSQVVVEFNGLDLYNYFNLNVVGTIQPKDIVPVSMQLSEALENQSNRIYDNSVSAIWVP